MFSGRSKGNIGKKRVILKILVTTVLLKLGIFGFWNAGFEFGTSESLLYVTGTTKSLWVMVWKNFVISYLKFRWWNSNDFVNVSIRRNSEWNWSETLYKKLRHFKLSIARNKHTEITRLQALQPWFTGYQIEYRNCYTVKKTAIQIT